MDYSKAKEESEALYFRFRNYTNMSQEEIDEIIDARVASPATFLLLEALKERKRLLDYSKRFSDSTVRNRIIRLVLMAKGYSRDEALQIMADADAEMDRLADTSKKKVIHD